MTQSKPISSECPLSDTEVVERLGEVQSQLTALAETVFRLLGDLRVLRGTPRDTRGELPLRLRVQAGWTLQELQRRLTLQQKMLEGSVQNLEALRGEAARRLIRWGSA